MIDFRTVKSFNIREGLVASVSCDGKLLWSAQKYKRDLLYLRSTGTQYIDTEYKPNQKSRLFATLAFFGRAGQNIAGVRNMSAASERFGIITFSSSRKFGAFIGDSSPQGGAVDDEIHDYEVSGAEGLIIDGVSYGGASTVNFSLKYTFPLFAWRNSGSLILVESAVYSFRLYEDDTLVRDFIPVLDMANEPCMYDKVSGKCFYNKGTGTFLYEEMPRIPFAYQEVEYLESNGAQYIDTGYYPHTESAMTLDFEPLMAQNTCYAGCRQSATRKAFTINSGGEGTIQYGAFDGTGNLRIATFNTTRKVVSIEKDQFFYNGTVTRTFSSSPFESDYPVYLFACGGPSKLYSTCRIYSCQIWDTGELIRDFIPCYRKSDEVGGMYDLISKEFFTNLGSGSFGYPK